MKVLFVGLYPMYHFHFVAELELMRRHLEQGDEVHCLTCTASLRSCEPNPDHHLPHCGRCIGLRQHGLGLLGERVVTHPLVVTPPPLRFTFRVPSSIQELKKLRIGNFDLGLAAYSSLIDWVKDVRPDLREHCSKLRILLQESLRVYESACEHLRRGGYDLVYIFNGRFAAVRPWVRACQNTGTAFKTHERGGALTRFTLYDNNLPHEPRQYPARFEATWEAFAEDPEREEKASEFFATRAQGRLSNWKSFVEDQEQGKLPDGFDPDADNLAIFSSTQGELAALGGIFDPRVFPNQQEGLLYIAAELANRAPAKRLYLRVHPASQSEQDKWWLEPAFQRFHNLYVIPPESPISTYALLGACQTVLTFGSTIGVEATYWRKVSILANESFFRGIDVVYEPGTPEQVVRLLEKKLEPKPLEAALKFGLYYGYSGETFRHAEPLNYYTLAFRGVELDCREEIRRWIGASEKRAPVSGIAKWWRTWADGAAFRQLVRLTGGDFAPARKDVPAPDAKGAS